MNIFLSLLLSFIFITPPQDVMNDKLSNLNLSSQNYILYSMDSETVMAGKNVDEKIAVASIQKTLTLITAIELLAETDIKSTMITMVPAVYENFDYDASIAGFWNGEVLSIQDVLYGVALPSGADATRLISLHLTGSIEGLTQEMNKLAESIGMKNTHVKNTSGLDEEGQYTTLNDLVTLLNYALKNETFKTIYTSPTYTTNPTKVHPEGLEFNNMILTHAQSRNFPYLYGAKSGYTDNAGRALSSIASKDDMNYMFISTQAKVETRNHALDDAITVYDFLFDTYKIDTIFLKDQDIGHIDIKKASKPLHFKSQDDIKGIVPKKLTMEEVTSIFQPHEEGFVAPLAEGSEVGTWSLIYKKEPIYSTELITQKNVEPKFSVILLGTISAIFKAGMWIFILFAAILAAIFAHFKFENKRR